MGDGGGQAASIMDFSADPVVVEPLAVNALFISASPDGRFLAFQADGAAEIYLQRYVAAERMVRGRYLLQDDADRLIAEAEASKVLR